MSFMDEEDFAAAIRGAGKAVEIAEWDLAKADAIERRTVAVVMMKAEAGGAKTNAAQLRAADESMETYGARLDRGVAKGKLAAARAELMAAEIQFKTWQTKQASVRMEKRAYGA